MSVHVQPKAAFGQSEPAIQPAGAPSDRKAKPVLFNINMALMFGAPILILTIVGATFWALPGGGRLSADAARARQQVIEIVNQPVTHLPRAANAEAFSPGWFHPGAIRPDFNNVDVSTTQEFPYDNSTYVTSNLNPSEMFIGKELEFNSMTKIFYVDRTLPKKRLSQAEMLRINRLYRIIGHNERVSAVRWTVLVGLLGAAFFLATALFLQVRRPA